MDKCHLCESIEPALVLLTVHIGKQQALVCGLCIAQMRGSKSEKKAVGK